MISDLSGFIGIAPFSAVEGRSQSENFLLNMKSQGLIDHLIVTLINDSADDRSLVKFGSYANDASTLSDGDPMILLKTMSSDSWVLGSTEVKLGEQSFLYKVPDETPRKLLIEP